jgi:hypothetical protein
VREHGQDREHRHRPQPALPAGRQQLARFRVPADRLLVLLFERGAHDVVDSDAASGRGTPGI